MIIDNSSVSPGIKSGSVPPVIVKITGYVAVNITNPDGSVVWKVGRLLLDNNSTSDFFAVGDMNSTPPSTIGTHTIQAGYSWAYHTKQLVWHEVDTASYTAIQANNNQGNKTYTALSPSTGLANASSCNGLAVDKLGIANIEVVASRANQGNPPNISTLPWSGNLASTYLNPNPAQAFGASVAALPAYSTARSATNGTVAWSLLGKNWVVVDCDQVISEMCADGNGNILWWRPNLVSGVNEVASSYTYDAKPNTSRWAIWAGIIGLSVASIICIGITVLPLIASVTIIRGYYGI